jgi:NADPH:quinone reductase-like Zn-dependent oxidoreductase
LENASTAPPAIASFGIALVSNCFSVGNRVGQGGRGLIVATLDDATIPDFIYRGLSLHGFWLINWIRNAPRTEIQEIYQKLGDLVADGSLSAVVETVYALEQFKEAFDQSLKSKRGGKILFKFGATH